MAADDPAAVGPLDVSAPGMTTTDDVAIDATPTPDGSAIGWLVLESAGLADRRRRLIDLTARSADAGLSLPRATPTSGAPSQRRAPP